MNIVKKTSPDYSLLYLMSNSSDCLLMDPFMEIYLSSQDSHMPENQNIAKPKDQCLKNVKQKEETGSIHVTDLPPEIIQHILRYLSFDSISKLRLVSRYFNDMCSSLLNSEFNHLRTMMLQKFHAIKALMPRRESARRKHPLSRECDIIETLHMRLSLLHMTFGKHIERKYCCFFPGEIIDEIYRILHYIKITPSLNRAYKVTDELFDLSTMAMEYFKECIEPSLPEISYLSHDLLEHPNLVAPRSEINHRPWLCTVENTNLRKESAPKSDSMAKFQKELKSTKEIAKRNKRDIIKIKQSMKSAKKRISSLVKELQQIKWQQKNCNINDILLDIKRQKQELSKCAYLTNSSNSKLSVFENSFEKNIQYSDCSVEGTSSDCKSEYCLSTTSTALETYQKPVDAELISSLKESEESELNVQSENFSMAESAEPQTKRFKCSHD